MKVAPIMEAFDGHAEVEQLLVHTGQHHDVEMSQVFLDDLGIRRPDINLGLRSTSEGSATGRMMVALQPVLAETRPDCVVVVGDADSAIAAALTAVRLGLPCVHVEAGLRSFDASSVHQILQCKLQPFHAVALQPFQGTLIFGAGHGLSICPLNEHSRIKSKAFKF